MALLGHEVIQTLARTSVHEDIVLDVVSMQVTVEEYLENVVLIFREYLIKFYLLILLKFTLALMRQRIV